MSEQWVFAVVLLGVGKGPGHSALVSHALVRGVAAGFVTSLFSPLDNKVCWLYVDHRGIAR